MFGAAVSLMQDPVPVGEQTATENHKQNKATIAPTIGDKSKAWYTKATIGSGRIIVRDHPETITQANRDVTRTTSETDESGFDPIYGYIPINHDYSDRPRSWEEVGERLKGAAGVAIDTVQYGTTQTLEWFGTQLPEAEVADTSSKHGNKLRANTEQDEQETEREAEIADEFFASIEDLISLRKAEQEQDAHQCLIPVEENNKQSKIPGGAAGELLHYVGVGVSDIEHKVARIFRLATDYVEQKFPQATQKLRDIGSNIADLAGELLMTTPPGISDSERANIIQDRKELAARFSSDLENRLNAFSTHEQRKAVEYLLPFMRSIKATKLADATIDAGKCAATDVSEIFGVKLTSNKPAKLSQKTKLINKLDELDNYDKNAHALRNAPGRAIGGDKLPLIEDNWFRGTHQNAGKLPRQIADQMRGMEFRNFDHFRQSFWKLVAKDPNLSKEFKVADLKNMKSGLAPVVDPTQRINGANSYQLHHVKPIHDKGGVYDLDNIVVVTPRYHSEILDPKYHKGGKN